MVPTTFSNSSNMITISTATIGVASLILEGRLLSDEDYTLSNKKHIKNISPLINNFPNTTVDLSLPSKLGATITSSNLLESSSSILPFNSSELLQSSFVTNSLVLGKSAATSSIQAVSSLIISKNVSSMTCDYSSQHFQRIRQKLTQLRQASPISSSDQLYSVDHKINIGKLGNCENNVKSLSCKISARNSSNSNDVDREHFQISSGAKSQIQENNNSFSCFQNLGVAEIISKKNKKTDQNFCVNKTVFVDPDARDEKIEIFNSCCSNSINFVENTLQSYSIGESPRYFVNETKNEQNYRINLQKNYDYELHLLNNREHFVNDKLEDNKNINYYNAYKSCANILESKRRNNQGTPIHGPHCDLFLKKIGLNSSKEQQTELEDHVCDMANLNEFCFYWQVHCRQLEVILSSSDPICIEVYLGPESHSILLEQWIIQKVEMCNTPTMTIQALCNAIRSQLYFSQISAWSDSIRKLNPFDKEIIGNPRIRTFNSLINICKTKNSGSSGSVKPSSNSFNLKKPRLDIFYRIKSFDSTASFNSKPNIHNFPNALIAGNCAISVCLKSLPRLHNGIPKISEVNKKITLNQSTTLTSEKDSSISRTQENSMLLDDIINIPCKEKGKHKCNFNEDDGAISDAVAEGSDRSLGSGSIEDNNCSNSLFLSHRDKQLIKYRKRMMKRDKNTKNEIILHTDDQILNCSTSFNPNNRNEQNLYHKQKKESSIEYKNEDINKYNNLKLLDGKMQINEMHLLQQQQELGSINSIGLPLYQTIKNITDESVQTQPIEMISKGTQTINSQITPCCEKCGSQTSSICFFCFKSGVKKPLLELNTDYMNHADKKKSPDRKLGKGDLLLQAIQKAQNNKSQDLQRNYNVSNNFRSNLNLKSSDINQEIECHTSILSQLDCQLCKRQKTQHSYKIMANHNKSIDMQDRNNSYINKSFCNEEDTKYQQTHFQKRQENLANNSREINCKCSSDLLSLDMDDFQTYKNEINKINSTTNSLLPREFNNNLSPSKIINQNSQHGTPKFQNITAQNEQQTRNVVPKSQHLLQINCDLKGYDFKSNKILPKTNLTNIFCGKNQKSPPTSIIASNLSSCTSPKAINQKKILVNSQETIAIENSNNSIGITEIFVQKLSSGSTLPNSPALSPRFLKQALACKHRSRHLSDRSDRSSLGSDDLSDEDIESQCPSPILSPLKSKFFTKLSVFAQRPLLGNLEESLLQKRLLPKMNVNGFKVLLGASGQFCPTQLTIPAAAYFYELEGEILSTPYVCEIRISRKGYTIPRFGTVQATLLNPLGTVVRMFVIPYDFRDMPPMHQTFIRQRILALDSEISKDEFPSTNLIKNAVINQCKDNNNNKQNINKSNNNNNNNLNQNYGNNNNDSDNSKSNIQIKNNILLNVNSSRSNRICKNIPQPNLRSLRYSIHLRFQTSRSGRLSLHSDIRFLISRRTDCDTAAAHAKSALESPNELKINTVMPDKPKYSARQDSQNSNKN